MKNPPKIGILGCGWLGQAAAKVLLEKGYEVKGSKTSKDGAKSLAKTGVESYVIELKPTAKINHLKAFINEVKVLVIAIPPKIRQTQHNLFDSLKIIFENYDFSDVEKLVYISSTGVFEDGSGVEYDELSKPNNTSERGQYLIALEDLIQSQNKVEKSIIIRYGGLIKHDGRHPVHFLSGRKGIKNPDAPVNLIEQSDAVKLLSRIIESSDNSKFYHGVYPSHPGRKEYYTKKAKALGVTPPEFESGKKSLGKIILSQKTQSDLGFRFESGI